MQHFHEAVLLELIGILTITHCKAPKVDNRTEEKLLNKKSRKLPLSLKVIIMAIKSKTQVFQGPNHAPVEVYGVASGFSLAKICF